MAHRPAESRLKAMAVPITSCMSEPMMAISIISQSSTRGTWWGQGTVRCLSPESMGAASGLETPVPRLWQATQSSVGTLRDPLQPLPQHSLRVQGDRTQLPGYDAPGAGWGGCAGTEGCVQRSFWGPVI